MLCFLALKSSTLARKKYFKEVINVDSLESWKLDMAQSKM